MPHQGRKYRLNKAKFQAPNKDKWVKSLDTSNKILILACGALSKEISTLIRLNGLSHLETQYLPAKLHNDPQKITEQLRINLLCAQAKFSKIFVGYADCGTGGEIDSMLDEFGVQRLPGAHCYEFFSGDKSFSEMMDEEPGSFFLTDFLVVAFEKLVWQGLKIDQYPELLQVYFRNYKKLVYLGQTANSELQRQAKEIARRLGLKYDYLFTGYGELKPALSALSNKE